jgi:hypothetical protein
MLFGCKYPGACTNRVACLPCVDEALQLSSVVNPALCTVTLPYAFRHHEEFAFQFTAASATGVTNGRYMLVQEEFSCITWPAPAAASGRFAHASNCHCHRFNLLLHHVLQSGPRGPHPTLCNKQICTAPS